MTAAGRPPIVGGNWKMNTTRDEARTLVRALREQLEPLSGVEVVICPPSPWLAEAHDLLEGSPLRLGAQDVHSEAQGAFTGAISAPMLRGVVDYVIVGHSERRHVFGDADAVVAAKLRAVLDAELLPILAVGETLEERERGETEAVVGRQLRAALEGLGGLPAGLVVAYEPVWAIGTGRTATPEQAEIACAQVRAVLGEIGNADAASACRIQYGGSVNAANIEALAEQPDVDGVLVGGASLDAEQFTTICRVVAASHERA